MAKKAAKKKASSKSARSKSAKKANYLDDVRELVRLMVDNDLNELDIQDNGRKIVLKRGVPETPASSSAPVAAASAPVVAGPVAGGASVEEASVSDGLIEIKSPMVGTFYATPSPDGDPFVSVGDTIGEDTVVCIVEAMKVMNEIKAECAGTIVEVCAKDVQPVEFGQVIFRVEPA